MSRPRGQGGDDVLCLLAAGAALAAGFLAVRQHSATTAAGYRLAVAQREGIEYGRIAAEAERRVASLRTPAATNARAAAMKLRLTYPKRWNVVEPSALEAPAPPAAPADGRRP